MAMSGKLCKIKTLPKDCDEFLVPPKGGLRGIIDSDPHADARVALGTLLFAVPNPELQSSFNFGSLDSLELSHLPQCDDH